VESYKTVTLLAAPSSVRVATHLTRAWLDDIGVDRVEDTTLVVAELVTNAVVHGAPPIVLHLWRELDGVRVGVSDHNPMGSVGRPSEPTSPSGHGLRIVDRLVERWGSAAHEDGKIVWAEIPVSLSSVDLRTGMDDRSIPAGRALEELTERADATMILVTAAYRGERAGCLVGFHCQCSIDPVRHAVWLSKANHTCRVAMQATHLGIHFLGTEDRELARLFGEETGDEIDKFASCDATAGAHGVPILPACPDRIVAQRVTAMDDGSDHVCFIVEPVDAHRGADRTSMRLSDVSDLEPGHAAEDRAPVT
jgi:flavin reductase (DIM6/NTAB) family NADH-FMN oxidoreductase RutF/anti-sigma regulatory factor (Ser/Thr protein kinase)